MHVHVRILVLIAAVLALTLPAFAGDGHPVARPFGVTAVVGEASCPADQPVRLLQTDPKTLAADHILGQQCHNGGFGWPHDDCSATYHNITGAIVLGVLEAYAHTEDPYHLLGAVNGGSYSLTSRYDNGEARFGSFAPYFFWSLARYADNTTFATFAATGLFDELAAGTYGPNDRDTAGWIAEIEAVRTGTWVNLRPWEFHTLIPAARWLGQPGQDALFEQGVLDGLATLDNSDPASVYSDILGVAGAVRGLAFAWRLSFPAISAPLHTGVDGLDSLEGLAAYLASLQNPDGSWYWHSNLAAPGDGDKDAQTTAYAVLALLEADIKTAADYGPAYRAGRDWLASLIGPDGSIPSYPGGDENTEVEGEALAAIAAVDALHFLDGFEAGNLDLWSASQP